jgi:hypothetical protein
MLERVVPEETNARCRRWLDDHHAGDGPAELQELLDQEWFFEGVVRNAQGAGAMRSLLGADYVEPTWLTYFKGVGPAEANQWHIDGGSPLRSGAGRPEVVLLPGRLAGGVGSDRVSCPARTTWSPEAPRSSASRTGTTTQCS